MKIGAEFGVDHMSEKKVIFSYKEIPHDSVPDGMISIFEKNPGIMEIIVQFDLGWYGLYKRMES